jgi:DNA-binding NtrC family response regulator
MTNKKSVEMPAHPERILVIEDDPGIATCVDMLLKERGYRCTVLNDGTSGLARLRAEEFDLLITDLRLPDMSGLDILGVSKAERPDLPVMLMTSYSSLENAIDALRKGAIDYLIKPFDNDEFLFAVERALNEQRTRRENTRLRRSLRKAYGDRNIIGASESVRRMLEMIRRVASTDANVLIQGESGTGKELVAQAIHSGGARADRPFVAINCGAIPSDLIESELFGHAKGAFTGAVSASEGLIREASGGTLFLDEISELPLNVQVKLLRVIQERQVRPVGATQSYHTDTRFVAAANRDLRAETENNTFRADLFYRLNVITIQVPPLRERGDDIEILAQHFLDAHCKRLGISIRGMSKEFVDFLREHHWPGNIRELENMMERAVIMAESELLTLEDSFDMLPQAAPVREGGAAVDAGGGLLSIEDYIREAILRYQDEYSDLDLAAMLGIGRKALWMRRRRWGLMKDRGRGDDAVATPQRKVS